MNITAKIYYKNFMIIFFISMVIFSSLVIAESEFVTSAEEDNNNANEEEMKNEIDEKIELYSRIVREDLGLTWVISRLVIILIVFVCVFWIFYFRKKMKSKKVIKIPKTEIPVTEPVEKPKKILKSDKSIVYRLSKNKEKNIKKESPVSGKLKGKVVKSRPKKKIVRPKPSKKIKKKKVKKIKKIRKVARKVVKPEKIKPKKVKRKIVRKIIEPKKVKRKIVRKIIEPKKVKRKKYKRKSVERQHFERVLKILEKGKIESFNKIKRTPLKKLEKELSIKEYNKLLKGAKKDYKTKDFDSLTDSSIEGLYLKEIKNISPENLRRLLDKKDYKVVTDVLKRFSSY